MVASCIVETFLPPQQASVLFDVLDLREGFRRRHRNNGSRPKPDACDRNSGTRSNTGARYVDGCMLTKEWVLTIITQGMFIFLMPIVSKVLLWVPYMFDCACYFHRKASISVVKNSGLHVAHSSGSPWPLSFSLRDIGRCPWLSWLSWQKEPCHITTMPLKLPSTPPYCWIVRRRSYTYHIIASKSLVTVLFADGVVVWRMYVLCALHFSRKILLVPILLYGMLCGL